MPRQARATRFAVHGLKLLVSGALVLVLQACATTPQPKYPIYMQDKPAEAAPPVARNDEGQAREGQAREGQASSSTEASAAAPPAVPAPQGHVAVSDLPPPPPPPPENETAPAPHRPVASAPVKEARAGYVYVLVAHDTLYGISRRFGVSVKEITALNGLSPDASLRIGEKVMLPPSAKDGGADPHANGPGLVRLAAPQATQKPAPKTMAARTDTSKAATPKVPEKTETPVRPAVKPAVSPPAETTTTTTTTTAAPTQSTTTQTTTTQTATQAPAAPPAPAGFPSNARLAEMGHGLFVWPVHGKLLVPFGQLAPNVRNDGINIGASAGTEVKAAADGVVVYEGDQVKELGNTVYIKHDGGWYTGYSHLESMRVKNNEHVTKGEVIGTVGQTGVIDKPQLHFEVRYTPSTDIARPIDPTLVLPKWAGF